jgi:hypothetical protein
LIGYPPVLPISNPYSICSVDLKCTWIDAESKTEKTLEKTFTISIEAVPSVRPRKRKKVGKDSES